MTKPVVVAWIATTSLLLSGSLQAGRFGAPVDPNYDQTITPALSAGFVGARDAMFAGLTVNYGQAINQGWSWNVALAWDNEKSRAKAEQEGDGWRDKRVSTFTVIGTAGFAFSPDWDISFGFGKGIIDDDNRDRDFGFVNGDWSGGTSLGWSFWKKDQRRLNLSTSLEYNISQHEPSISFDLGYGFSF